MWCAPPVESNSQFMLISFFILNNNNNNREIIEKYRTNLVLLLPSMKCSNCAMRNMGALWSIQSIKLFFSLSLSQNVICGMLLSLSAFFSSSFFHEYWFHIIHGSIWHFVFVRLVDSRRKMWRNLNIETYCSKLRLSQRPKQNTLTNGYGTYAHCSYIVHRMCVCVCVLNITHNKIDTWMSIFNFKNWKSPTRHVLLVFY